MSVEEEESVGGSSESWWKKHGMAVFILSLAMAISVVIRVLYAYQLIGTCDISYCFAGGSDSFYHSRVMTWIITQHTNLVHDSLLNYPVGAVNPREPLFDWMNAILGLLFAPFFGGNATTAGMWVLEMEDPIWAALGVIPVYLLGKEVSSKRMGLLAAILYPLVVGNIQSTVATYANYLPFYTFFILLSVVTYLHAIKLSGTRRWVESYRSPRAIWAGVKEFCRVEEYSVRWGVFSGVTLGATMLAWQGYTYVVAIVVVFMAIMMFVERIRRHDSFGAYLITLLSGTIGFVMAMPYYYVQGEFGYWFTVPVLLYFGGMLLLLPFLMMRDTPWVLSIPILLGSFAAGAAGLFLYSPSYFDAVITGQGYFVKNLIFSTVAEAQAPSFDALIVSYGVATFVLTFVGLALFVAYMFIYRFRREHVFMVIFGLLSIYLPISAAKFFLLGSPIFVLFPAEVLLIAIDRIGGYPQLRRNLSTLGDRGGGRFAALRRSIKVRHLIVGIITVLVVLPNVSWAVDSGIPYNVQSQYSTQIYNSLPSELQTSAANASSFYLGIGGIETDTPQQYDEAGYNWLGTQDTSEPPAQRPALVSWWDYGFQTIDESQHPVVADNFQDGIDPSGNFLLAQNESLAIATLAADLLISEAQTSGNPYLPSALDARLAADGVNTTALHNFMINTTQDIATVLANPSFTNGYGTHDPANLDALNSEYDTVAFLLASTLSEDRVVQVYQDLQAYTGWSIRYAMADTRLFPTSGSNTGIYYAPVDLTDGVIGAGGIPTSYFTVTVTGSDGNTYPLGDVPAGVSSVSSQINYETPFYNSMIYKIEVGYNGTQVGTTGIPGLTDTSNNPEPGYMMQHFMMVYRTAYWCPYTDYQAHPNCFQAVNTNTANYYSAHSIGTSDTSASSYFDSGGETMLEYYAGATVEGEVATAGGVPVPGVRVTVNDQWGTPHMTTVTGANGLYTLIAPPGNDTIVSSFGSVNPLTMEGNTTLSTTNLTIYPYQGDGDDPYAVTANIGLKMGSVSGQVYWNRANSSSYESTDVIIPGATVKLSNGIGTVATTVSDPSGVYDFKSVQPGAYNLTLQVGSATEAEGYVSVADASAVTQDLGLRLTDIHGAVVNESGQPVVGAVITLHQEGGFTTTDTSMTNGNYSFTPLAPGNYTVSAYYPGGQTSPTFHVSLATFTSNVTLNITLSTPITVTLRSLYEGTPVPGMLVRFTPLSGGSNQTEVFQAGSNGWLTASLTTGNWSVYALGAVNGTYVSGLGDLHLSSSGLESLLGGGDTLQLSPAAELWGKVYVPGASGGQSGVSLAVQSSLGSVLTTTTNTSGTYALYLPVGSYALTANYTSSSGSDAAFGGVTLSQDTRLDLTLATSVAFQTTVGYVTASGTFVPLSGAGLNLTQVQDDATLQLAAGSSGSITVNLPETTATYDLSSRNYGFANYEAGPLTVQQLNSLYGRIDLAVSEIPVHVAVLNSSLARVAPEVNFTALTSDGVTTTFNGTSGTVDLYPGEYQVSAWAPSSTGGNLQLFTNVTMTLPIGAVGVFLNLTLYGTLVYRINATTSGLVLGNTYAVLNGAGGTFSMNGTQLLRGFTAPSGVYNLWLRATNSTGSYAYFDPVTLYHNSTAVPDKTPLLPAGSLAFSMVSPLGQAVNASVPVVFSNGNGTYGSFTTFPYGNATLVLPRGGYNFTVSDTVTLYIGGVSQFWTIETNSSADTCAVNPFGPSSCQLRLLVTRAMDQLQGRVTIGGLPIQGADGTVLVTRLNATGGAGSLTFPVVAGAIDLSLLPGYYVLYTVVAPGGVPYVNITTLAIDYSSEVIAFSPGLSPGWEQTLDVIPARGLPIPNVVTVTISVRGGPNVTLTNVSVSALTGVALPSGSYALTATAQVEQYSNTVQLTAQDNISVSSSNAFLAMSLVPQWVVGATISQVGHAIPPVMDGQVVSVPLVVNITGNEGLSLRVSGSPSTWKIVVDPGNFSLGAAPNNRSIAIDAQVYVPASAGTTSPPLVFSLYRAGATSSLTSVTVPLSIVPVYGFTVASATGGESVTPTSEVLEFSITETGNTAENVAIEIANGATLTADGWAFELEDSTGAAITSAETLNPDSTGFSGKVVVFAHSAVPTIPAGVLVQAVDTAHPESTGTGFLPFLSHGTLGLNTSAGVTGPSVGGSPPPSYQAPLYEILVFVPFVAILVIAASWRMWRNRRWVRT